MLNRCQKVYLNANISDTSNISRGVPQGSILGPLLSCMYINDVPDVLVDYHIHIHADEVQLYTRTRKENIDSCLHLINSDLDRFGNWASANELCFIPSKSKCIMFSRTNISSDIHGLRNKGNKISLVGHGI